MGWSDIVGIMDASKHVVGGIVIGKKHPSHQQVFNYSGQMTSNKMLSQWTIPEVVPTTPIWSQQNLSCCSW
jgi:hypothetical protein